MDRLFPVLGDDSHVSIASHEISTFIDVDRGNLMCFRCGETGHVRSQCLTFRVRLCLRHETDKCNERNCTYAHGSTQIRTPWKARCVRVIKQGGQLVCIGCNSESHTFRKCPLHQDVIML